MPPIRALSLAATGLVGVVLVAVLLFRGGDDERVVRAAFASGTNLISGSDVRVGGEKVGQVVDVDYEDGQALMRLRIDDDRVWPLHRGTTATIRFATTISVATRYVELKAGPRSAPPIPPEGLLTRSDTITPVEFDEALDIVDREGREDLDALLHGAAEGVGGQERALRRTLDGAPEGFGAAADLLHELGADPAQLETLVTAGSRTARAIAGRDGQLRELLDSAAATFDEVATRAEPVRMSLERMPTALRAIQRTLSRADRSRKGLEQLVGDLRPGARELRATTPSIRRAVQTLGDLAPLATQTLRTGSRAAPDISALLQAAAPFIDTARDTLEQAPAALACIRPYGPEIAGFASTWAGMTKNFDSTDHYFRALIAAAPFTTATPLRSRDVVGTIPGITYAFPRGPGVNAGQPWWQPQCGAGPEALDPTKDPESRG